MLTTKCYICENEYKDFYNDGIAICKVCRLSRKILYFKDGSNKCQRVDLSTDNMYGESVSSWLERYPMGRVEISINGI
jgi:hypothetical protein